MATSNLLKVSVAGSTKPSGKVVLSTSCIKTYELIGQTVEEVSFSMLAVACAELPISLNVSYGMLSTTMVELTPHSTTIVKLEEYQGADTSVVAALILNV